MVPAFLVFIDDDWELCMEFTGAVHPHIAFASGSSVIVDYLGGVSSDVRTEIINAVFTIH